MSKADEPEVKEETKQEEETNQENQENQEGGEELLGKGEKKIRKALLKLGLNKIEGVNRVTIRQKDNYFFIVKDPEVYVSKESDSSYVIFGELSMDDDRAMGNQALENLKAEGNQVPETTTGEKVEVVDDDVEESEEGLDKESIDMVISEAKCSRQKAVKALKKNNGDVVTAILELNN